MRSHLRHAVVSLTLLLLAACAGGDTPVTPTAPTPAPPAPEPAPPGVLVIAVEGLPDGLAANVSVAGPGFSRTTTAPVTWNDLPAGSYSVAVLPVRGVAGTYAGTTASMVLSVLSGSLPAVATVRYAPLPSALDVVIAGVPGGVAAPVLVTTPTDSVISASGSAVHTSVASGTWRIAADTLLSGGSRYTPSTASQEFAVLHGDTARTSLTYSVASGAIAVSLGGLPAGVAALAIVEGPGAFSDTVTTSRTLTALVPGAYRVIARSVASGAVTFDPNTDTLHISVAASLVAAPAVVQYVAQVGHLVVTTTGLPAGAEATLSLASAQSVQSFAGAVSIDSLPSGSYVLSASPVVHNGVKYAATMAVDTIVISTGATRTVNVSYGVVPTMVQVTVAGLPTGAAADMVLITPDGANTPLTGATTVNPAAPGRWRLTAASITHGGALYTPTPTAYDTTLVAGEALALHVQYTISSGALAISVSGLPNGVSADVNVSGPNAYAQSVTGSATLSMLTPGTFTVAAASVTAGSNLYLPTPSTQQTTVSASLTPAIATVTYSLATGAITINASGLPGSATPTFTLTGPNGSTAINGAGVVDGLAPGAYTVAANSVSSGASTYTPAPTSANATVTVSGNTAVNFTYSAPSGPNFYISNVHLTQATQRIDGSVALVAGRDALLRVFVLASMANTAQPDVRVRVYDGATLLQTSTIPATEASVRQSLAVGTMSSSWNVMVPAANMRPGLRVVAELDPTEAIEDDDRSDNVWPASGVPHAFTTNNVPTFTVRFVPVVVGALTGNVTVGNHEQYLSTTRRIFPVGAIAASVRAPFTSSATELQSNDANGAWLTVLSEINSLRAADGAPSTTHYYGVVGTTYSSGIAGYGYLPGRAGIGWDKMPSGDRVAAHEWGHNFGRSHAPCGVSGDPNYPYAGGAIGQVGWNSANNTLVQANATDVMSYCSNQWISDYNWSAIMSYRGAAGMAAPMVAGSGDATASWPLGARRADDGLLVWGRVIDGRIQLEPAFRVRAPMTPAFAGTHRLELLDSVGVSLGAFPLRAELVDHATGRDERHFAVVVPWSDALERRVVSLRVRDVRAPLRSAVRERAVRGTQQAAEVRDPRGTVTSSAGRARVSWNSADYPMAMVRDAATGQVMGFVRRSGDAVATDGRAIEVVYSDGVRSVVRR